MVQPLRKTGIAFAILILTALPAVGQQREDPSQLATEGLSKMVQALEALMRSIPQYEKPEINENGDIIIRRKRPSGPHRLPKPNENTGPDKEKAI